MGIVAALFLEALILLFLFMLGINTAEKAPQGISVTSFDTSDASEDSQEESAEEESSEAEEAEPVESPPVPSQVSVPMPPPAYTRPEGPTIAITPPEQTAPTPPQPTATPTRRRGTIGTRIREGSGNGGPPDTGRPGPPDSQIVGTAPDGSPLYAAQWYREPRNDELSGYLSAANSAGWGLIACKTAPDWRVEQCQIVSESPQGSNIARSAREAAWQFLVRPARVDGKYKVGSWVRIRISYSISEGPPR